MDDRLDELKPIFEQLTAERNPAGKTLTQQAMADRLNTMGIPSLSAQTWSKYSVRRYLKRLALQAMLPGASPAGRRSSAKLSDDEIRQRIKQGRYDTPSERFIVVPVAQSEPKKAGKKKLEDGGKPGKQKSKKKKKKGKK